MRVLVVEDERELAILIRASLERGGFAADVAATMASAGEHLALTSYDACILDLGLPDGSGLQLLQTLRKGRSTLPILILTARDGLEDRVTGLDAGADDYVVKPFHMPELIARIRALLRRPNAALGVSLTFGNLLLETTSRQVKVSGRDIGLSVRETSMLELLLRRQETVVTRQAAEQHLYSFDAEVSPNALEVLVHRLRRRLQEADATVVVHTVRGVGYLMALGT
ncbi:response regulator [Acidisoma cladoniae]|jgi:two-component system response regulator QseB|uniref:response regulator n=1 Tax=Acidisoma cladoniae TaxID=3040935 RepID=UPI00254A9F0A|nr:response regulator transcription factor [Acidisoma sp. PAMC 29798]